MSLIVKRKFRSLAAAAIAVVSASEAQACLMMLGGQGPPTERERESQAREEVARISGLFEAEVMNIKDGVAAVSVLRVFRGPLRPKTKLNGLFGYSSCGGRPPEQGARGFVIIEPGSGERPTVRAFLERDLVAAYRRIGALPRE